MVEDLVHSTAVPAGNSQQLLHILRIQVGYAPTGDFTGGYQLFHPRNRLFQRNFSPPVQEIQIQMIRSQTLQTLFTAAGDPVQTGIMRVHLGN
ncbi:hypothetical protein D3C75_780590 [compost metagenome]